MSIRATKWAFRLFENISLPPAERSVLLALCWDHTDSTGCFPSQRRIVLLTGYRERKVRDLLKSLEDSGLIERRVTRSKGKFQRTEYWLFGSYKGRKPGRNSATSHRHKNADGDHRQTGAEYRGTDTTSGAADGNVATFPIQKIGNPGGAS